MDRELYICRTLNENLKNSEVHEHCNILRQSRQAKHFPIPTKIKFHKDPLSRYTIIEVITTDRTGLLADIGRVFIDLDIQLHDAKITTIGSRAEDMFYITNFDLKPITDESQLNNIREKLFLALKMNRSGS